MRKQATAGLAAFSCLVVLTFGCGELSAELFPGPAGACEATKDSTCTDGKKTNCEWTTGKNTQEEADKLNREHKFHEGKTCSDLGYTCSAGVCKKK